MDEKTAQMGPQPQGCFFCATAIPLLEQCCPEAAREHFRNARVELLMGLRSLIDERIAHLSKQEVKGAKVTVE
jgi:predicted nucleic acid-binding Zn ribbon protein